MNGSALLPKYFLTTLEKQGIITKFRHKNVTRLVSPAGDPDYKREK